MLRQPSRKDRPIQSDCQQTDLPVRSNTASIRCSDNACTHRAMDGSPALWPQRKQIEKASFDFLQLLFQSEMSCTKLCLNNAIAVVEFGILGNLYRQQPRVTSKVLAPSRCTSAAHADCYAATFAHLLQRDPHKRGNEHRIDLSLAIQNLRCNRESKLYNLSFNASEIFAPLHLKLFNCLRQTALQALQLAFVFLPNALLY